MIKELGKILLDLIKYIPEGIVVFFTSYEHMNQYIDFWKK